METKVKHKWIKGYEGLYSVGENGAVLSHSRLTSDGRPVRARYLSEWISTGGYPTVTLYKDTTKKHMRIHRILAQTFLHNPNNYDTVKHLDDDKLNYALDNLQWDTFEQNLIDEHAKHYVFRNPLGQRIEVYNLAQFCRDNKLRAQHMGKVANGKRTSHFGWTLWNGKL